MYELYPYFTNDGSVGLFSPSADDIYHSTYGALTEAYEKFILPSNIKDFLKKNSEIKILDICFGIGYNSKSFINFLLDFIYNDTIGSDNNINNDKIHTDNIINKKSINSVRNSKKNKKFKVFINAIDNDKNLALLSPFFVTAKNFNHRNLELPFKQEKIQKMLSEKTSQKFKLKKEVNIILLLSLIKQIDDSTIEVLKSKKYSQFFDKDLINLMAFLKLEECKYTPLLHLYTFLHNIYYKYISPSYKKAMNDLRLLDFNFNLNISDARQAVKNDNNLYNYVFLDAFTPTKCPCLWTVDFFKLLYSHLEDDGMILTYSNSALVRNAFFNAGFYVGKIYSDSANKFTGTIAVKNKSLIKYELSEYDLGLIKSKAGIFYRDENLSLDNEAIIKAHEIDVKNSNLISSSKFIKSYKNKSFVTVK